MDIREHENLKFVSLRIFRFVDFRSISFGILISPVNAQVEFLLVREEKILISFAFCFR